MSEFTQFSAEVMIAFAHNESKELGRNYWRVMKGFKYFVGHKDSEQWVDVPRGYLMDGASVPQFLWSVIPPWGAYGAATIVHDILCEYLQLTVEGVPCKISRKQADDILLEAMEVLGVRHSDIVAISSAVNAYRIIAGISKANWNQKKAALEAKWVAANPE